MKLSMRNLSENYTIEQCLFALFPGELPDYHEILPEDSSWAVFTEEADGSLHHFRTDLSYGGKTVQAVVSAELTGSDYEQEGQRRRLVGQSFYRAYLNLGNPAPPWGMITGVRPDKLVTSALEQGKTLEEAQRFLEEEYFVSPERAALACRTGKVSYDLFQGLQPKDISLYIGIPFCPTRCSYCSFVSETVAKSFALIPPYVDALIREIRLGGETVRRCGLRVRSFYMGGGTPTTLSASQMDAVLTALEESFDLSSCPELTVEAGRPDTISAEKLEVLARHKVTRLSVNPQSMNDQVLRAIGRCHSREDIHSAVELVRSFHFPHVNMDLIAGLPEDTPESFASSLDEVLSLGTDNITVHTLSLKKGSTLTTKGYSIPGPEDVAAMLAYASPTLTNAGFLPYYLYKQKYMSGSFENIGWSKGDSNCDYNIYIMSDRSSILSFGAGGSTKLVDLDHHNISRLFNCKYPKEYIEQTEKIQENLRQFESFYLGK